MINTYTQEAVSQNLDLIDTSLAAIWNDIETVPEDTEADRWRKKLQGIAAEFICSSRFALMRILLSRADLTALICQDEPAKGFSATLKNGDVLRFENITMEHARDLSKDELNDYEKLLSEIASRQEDADRENNTRLIKMAMASGRKRTTLLNRNEAFELGHSLGFSLQEMRWFMLRVLDSESDFCFDTSSDLIEAYGFLKGYSARHVQALIAEYRERYADVPTADPEERPVGWTRDMGESLEGLVAQWSPAGAGDEPFLRWIGGQAGQLDRTSATAQRIYRNLAAYLYTIELNAEIPKEEWRRNFLVNKVVRPEGLTAEARELLYDDGPEPSREKCKALADALLLINKTYSGSWQANKAKAYGVLSTMRNGKLRVQDAQMNVVNESGAISQKGRTKNNAPKTVSTNRICELLRGGLRVDKNDLLYLLWIYEVMCWEEFRPQSVRKRLMGFITMAKICLGEAMLPAFYPPHLMEWAMMYSIVCSALEYGKSAILDVDGNEMFHFSSTPAEVYNVICEAVRRESGKADDSQDAPGEGRNEA